MASDDLAYFGPFCLNSAERLLHKDNAVVPLGSRALDVLIALVEEAGEVISQRDLLDRAWPGRIVEEGNLRVTIAGLRKALNDGEEGARYIVNVTGRGYCFVAPVDRKALQPPPGPSAPRTLTSPPAVALPPCLARMVGREDAVRAISEQLAARRFVTIVGPGGMGKTTVAVSVAHALLDDFSGATYFVDLSALSDANLVPSSVAVALGIIFQADDPVQTLLRFVAERRMLLVLDNCEHVVEAISVMLERLFSSAPQVHLLATSREALRVEGEHVYLLQPLSNPPEGDELTAAMALASPAVQLLMERAAASGHATALSDTEAPIIADICRRLDGIPLAIELAGSRVGAYGIRGTAELLQNRFRLLWRGRRSALPRHQTLNAMLDWSHNLLSERDRKILRRLSVFVGVFSLEVAQAVVGDGEIGSLDIAETIAGLVDRSLLVWTAIDGVGHYRLLDTTRAYASAKLADSGEAHSVSKRHALTYAQIAKVGLVGEPTLSKVELERLSPHLGNIRVALEWCFSKEGDPEIGAVLAAHSAGLFSGLLLLAECSRWSEKGLEALRDQDRGSRVELSLHCGMAVSAIFAPGAVDVRRALEDGITLARNLADVRYEQHLLFALYIFLGRSGDFPGSLAVAQRMERLASDGENLAARALADCLVGCAHHWLGNQAAALVYLERSVNEARAVPPELHVFFGNNYYLGGRIILARVLWLSGYPDRARRVAREAVEEADNYRLPSHLCDLLIYSATVFAWNLDLDEAERCARRTLRYATDHGLDPYMADAEGLLGTIDIARGELRPGLERVRAALMKLQMGQHRVLATSLMWAIGYARARLGETEAALETIGLALRQSQDRGGSVALSSLHRARGEVYLLMSPPDPKAAEHAFLLALESAKSESALMVELRAAVSLASLWVTQGRTTQASDLLKGIYGRFTEGFDTVDLRAAARLLEQMGHVVATDTSVGV